MSRIWQDNLSSISRNSRPSPIREMLALIRQPGMISFAGGMPAPEVFPVDKFYEGAHILKDDGANLLQYGTTEGYPPLKEFLASWTAPRMGRKVNQDEILITTGSQQALDLFAWAMIDDGDLIITEDPSYLAALTVFYNHGGGFIGIPTDGEGMMVDMIPAAIEKARAEGKKVKFIYTIVNFHNPGGSTMSVGRRKKLVEISKNTTSDLRGRPDYVRYDGEHLPSIFLFTTKGLLRGVLLKNPLPGTRIGWVTRPGDYRNLTVFKQGTDLCSSTITQALVAEYCNKGPSRRPPARDYRQLQGEAGRHGKSLEKHLLPLGATWVKPEGGFFYWVKFPKINTNDLFKIAINKRRWPSSPETPSARGTGAHNARLNYTFSSQS